jgi:hypothetical protein
MIVVHDYHGFRIEVEAVADDGRWNANVRIRRILSSDKPHVETVTCFKLTADHAERAGGIWARRWVDLKETLAEVGQEYVDFKRAKGKRTVKEDEAKLARFKAYFGAEEPITAITAQRMAVYERQRVTETSKRGATVMPATVNRELAMLRHLLRLAEEWGYIDKAPRIRMGREPEGRLRWLTREQAGKLLDICEKSRNKPTRGRHYRAQHRRAEGRDPRPYLGSCRFRLWSAPLRQDEDRSPARGSDEQRRL